MSEQHDRQFIQTFSAVLAGLVAFTVVIIILALIIHDREFDGEQSAARQAAVEERLQPVGGVYAGETGRAAAQAAAEAAAASSEPQVAFEGSTDGEMIYGRVCAACHDSGAAGAPRLVAGEMGARVADKGRETLVSNAINGINAMPARGGRSDLSDEQVAASVDYMLDQVE
ncbi:c-type cytochrome [Wenzhouxiangella sediminis]|uniref:Cytochrome c5 family protein n=1 Tax=Wenzhouxiangella sediminis TaxID=1792836 RepID=A0A3E1K9F7_9GAMM|nr:c-type cytochrome [Wenzhouxiangella sediminis]RFF30751.1 cytochrome c5 family protein [Wenzhouxiangella sediminis]